MGSAIAFLGFKNFLSMPFTDTIRLLPDEVIFQEIPPALDFGYGTTVGAVLKKISNDLSIEDTCEIMYAFAGIPLCLGVNLGCIWRSYKYKFSGHSRKCGSFTFSVLGFWLASGMVVGIAYLSPQVWESCWMRISAVYCLCVVYLCLRSIVSGLCSCPLRGIPLSLLFPVFIPLFTMVIVEAQWPLKSWPINQLPPDVIPTLQKGWRDLPVMFRFFGGHPPALLATMVFYLIWLNVYFMYDVVRAICNKLEIPLLAPLRKPFVSPIAKEKKHA